MTEQYSFEYEVYKSGDDLKPEDRILLQAAREATANAYAPYSHFHVAAAARLKNGEIIKGTNQENASYPVGTCAERVVLGSIGALFPNEPIGTMAITYHNMNGTSDTPASPCGMCRQALREYEIRTQKPIRLILAGMEGKVFVIPQASMLLPLGFTSEDLK
ncbi:MAG TPA: cytidine deaminase [Chitinophagaceae bacterium]